MMLAQYSKKHSAYVNRWANISYSMAICYLQVNVVQVPFWNTIYKQEGYFVQQRASVGLRHKITYYWQNTSTRKGPQDWRASVLNNILMG